MIHKPQQSKSEAGQLLHPLKKLFLSALWHNAQINDKMDDDDKKL